MAPDYVSGKDFLVHSHMAHSVVCPQMSEGVKELFYKRTNPVPEDSFYAGLPIRDPGTSQRLYLLTPPT